MNRSHFDQIIDNYAARFVELNIGDNNEVYKWEIAAEFRPMMNVSFKYHFAKNLWHMQEALC